MFSTAIGGAGGMGCAAGAVSSDERRMEEEVNAAQTAEPLSKPCTIHSALSSTTSRSTAPSSSAHCSMKRNPDKRQDVNDAIFLAVSPGRQVGLFATRPLIPGERILSEAPLVTLNSPADLTYVVASLPTHDQDSFYALANAYEDQADTPLERGIFDTNAFSLSPSTHSVSSPSTGARYGIFPASSRLNHSCRPNVKASYSPSTGLLTTHVLRPISAGEELFTSYLGGPTLFASPSAARAERLAMGWAFTCSCEVCARAPSSPERQASDARRTELAVLHARLPGIRPRDPAQALRDCARALVLLEAEGLAVDGAEAFALPAARACAWYGDWIAGRVWAAIGWESARRAYGEGSEVERVLLEAKERPEGLVVGARRGERRDLMPATRGVLGGRMQAVGTSGLSWFSRLFGGRNT